MCREMPTSGVVLARVVAEVLRLAALHPFECIPTLRPAVRSVAAISRQCARS